MALVDAPLLDYLRIRFYQPVFDTPQVPQFVHRIEMFNPPIEAMVQVHFFCRAVGVLLFVSLGYYYILQCTG